MKLAKRIKKTIAVLLCSLSVIFIFVLSTSIFAGAFDLGLYMLGITPDKIVGWTNDEIFFEDPYGRIDSFNILSSEDTASRVVSFKAGDTYEYVGHGLIFVSTKDQEVLDYKNEAEFAKYNIMVDKNIEYVNYMGIIEERPRIIEGRYTFIGNGVVQGNRLVR